MAVTKTTTTNLTIIEKVSQIFIGTNLADIGFSRAEIKARALKTIYKINI